MASGQGGELLNKDLSDGEPPPWSQTPYNALLYTFLTENGTPSLYLLLTNSAPFHISFLELCIPFYFRNCNTFKVLINQKPQCFLDFFTAVICEAFWAFLQTEIVDFPTLS